MTNGISKIYEVTFKSTSKKGAVSTKTASFYGDTEAQAKTAFEKDAAKMLKHHGVKREFISIEFSKDNPTYSAAEDFKNRTGLDPIQYEEE